MTQIFPQARIILHPADPIKAAANKEAKLLRHKKIMACLKPLLCDGCGEDTKVFVYESDLNGSYFYCDDCVEKDDEELE